MPIQSFAVETRQLLPPLYRSILDGAELTLEESLDDTPMVFSLKTSLVDANSPRAAVLQVLDRILEPRRRRIRELHGPGVMYSAPSEEGLEEIGPGLWRYQVCTDETLEFAAGARELSYRLLVRQFVPAFFVRMLADEVPRPPGRHADPELLVEAHRAILKVKATSELAAVLTALETAFTTHRAKLIPSWACKPRPPLPDRCGILRTLESRPPGVWSYEIGLDTFEIEFLRRPE